MNKEYFLSHLNSYQAISSTLREYRYEELSKYVLRDLIRNAVRNSSGNWKIRP